MGAEIFDLIILVEMPEFVVLVSGCASLASCWLRCVGVAQTVVLRPAQINARPVPETLSGPTGFTEDPEVGRLCDRLHALSRRWRGFGAGGASIPDAGSGSLSKSPTIRVVRA